jgi:hypothetical protein
LCVYSPLSRRVVYRPLHVVYQPETISTHLPINQSINQFWRPLPASRFIKRLYVMTSSLRTIRDSKVWPGEGGGGSCMMDDVICEEENSAPHHYSRCIRQTVVHKYVHCTCINLSIFGHHSSSISNSQNDTLSSDLIILFHLLILYLLPCILTMHSQVKQY